MEPVEIAVRVTAMRLPSAARTPSSFDELFAREAEPMIRLAISLVDTRERAEEIVQDAFEKTLLSWRRLDRPGAYVRAAVVNGCRTELRRRLVVRRAVEYPVDQIVASPADSELLDALARLTPKRRIALTLRYYADLPEAEIAELMGVRLGTVKSLVSRGLADLRKVVTR
jgi:RNA polymerase sigma factor (sigma-70 family)